MIPKEKAKELVYKMSLNVEGFGWEEMAKQCALIAVDELIKEVNHSDVGYWYDVKQEIEKL